MRRPLMFLGGHLAALLLGAGPALAHPHIWISAQPTLRLDGTMLQAIELRWRFDELFSDFLLGDYDTDGDGAFDAAETERIAAEAFGALAEFGWLTHLRVDGERVDLPTYRDLAVTAEKGTVSYRFVLPLPAPVDLARGAVVLSLYDDSFYIDVALEEQEPIRFVGTPATGCTAVLFEDADHPIYFGVVNPLAADLKCAVS